MTSENTQPQSKAQELFNVIKDNGPNATKALAELIILSETDAVAQNYLAYCYYHGCGVMQDSEKAVELFHLAANQEFAPAQFNLGVCYYHGNGVIRDLEKTVEYLHLAADRGCVEAQRNLGACYYNGEGVEKDNIKAVHYFSLAAQQGEENAINALNDIIK